MRPTTDPFLYFSVTRKGDSGDVNEYRTKLVQAQLQMSGVDSWTETGWCPIEGHLTYILVAGNEAMQLARVAELAHMNDTRFYHVQADTYVYREDPRDGHRVPMGWLKLVKPAQLNDMLLTQAPYLRVDKVGERGAEFYVIGS